jgi:hypothetical protein
MATGAEALQIYRVGQQDPIDMSRKHIVHFKGTYGYLESYPAGPIQLGKQLSPPIRGIGEPEVPLFLSVVRLRVPLTTMNISGVQI